MTLQEQKPQSFRRLKKMGKLLGLLVLLFFAYSLGASNDNSQAIIDKPTLNVEEIKTVALSDITYDDLLRNNEKYVGNTVHYKGKVVQVYTYNEGTYVLRISISDNKYDEIIYSNYIGKRVLDGDLVEFWGTVKGIESYNAVLGNQVNIPKVDILILELIR